jgi:phosphatidate cytidylyltransferase
MKDRVITALILLGVLIVVVWQVYTPVLVIAVAFFAAVSAGEIMSCAKVENTFIRVVGCVFAACVPFFASPKALTPWVSETVWGVIIGTVPPIVYVTALTIIMMLAMLKGYSYTSFEDVTVSVFASVFIPYAFSMFIKLRDMYEFRPFGVYLIFYALICALVTDTGAHLMGVAFGKHKMSPNISPKKTVEGAIGGLLFSIVFNAIALTIYNRIMLAQYNPTVSPKMATVLLAASPFVACLGMAGDLSASALKRNFGIKDFGSIFPGHGGVMDRFDSTMFTLPLTYVIALITSNIF